MFGGYNGSLSPLMETNSVYSFSDTYILQQEDRITGWKTRGSWYDVNQAHEEARLFLSYQPEIRIRIISNPSMKIIFDSDHLITGQVVADDLGDSHWGSIGSSSGGSGGSGVQA